PHDLRTHVGAEHVAREVRGHHDAGQRAREAEPVGLQRERGAEQTRADDDEARAEQKREQGFDDRGHAPAKRSHTTRTQTIPASARAPMTAAEPRSFARPASGWYSVPIRSTAASTPEFRSSTISTSTHEPIRSARSTPLRPSQSATGASTAAARHSMRKAHSWVHAARRPAIEQRVARNRRRAPFRSAFNDVSDSSPLIVSFPSRSTPG